MRIIPKKTNAPWLFLQMTRGPGGMRSMLGSLRQCAGNAENLFSLLVSARG